MDVVEWHQELRVRRSSDASCIIIGSIVGKRLRAILASVKDSPASSVSLHITEYIKRIGVNSE